MELRIALPSLQSPFHVMPQASASFAASLWHGRHCSGGMNQKVAFEGVFLSPVSSRKLLRVQNFDKFSNRGHLRVSCRAILDGGLGEEPFEFRDGLSLDSEGCCTISEKSVKGSNFPSQFDFLEPGMLGIVPEPPNWPEREALLWASVEHRAKSFELPLSLRMIKKKQQWEVGVRGLEEMSCCSVRKAFSSMVFIIVELQSKALQMREALCDEELELIVSKVQREMHLSFAWMFQQVFSRTPELMIHVMTLLANFSVYSVSDYETMKPFPGLSGPPLFIQNPNGAPEELSQDQELSESETTNMGALEDVGLNHEFVSPLSLEFGPDHDPTAYYRTDFMYQIMLSQDPHNPLLLCNYAQFLQLIIRDYDRAEECFKRAIQVEPLELDAEVLSQYARFLWKVRKDLTGAEDVYLQAIAAAEKENLYYTSQYASFLWSTGGEDTCFPLN
ncbi:PREDICTED: uncharacterized protein LOC109186587 [Ipomoea nil]|uniref:uncharacterized protein LOC109186587 n=1 Tax=Ipomoea nil TaxID=35883 RepID=UPI00090098E6|nr:PREDICTED: uncharacterized protein LOC109186587 [Ipomoea nil]